MRSPLLDLWEQTTARRKLDPQLSKLAQLAEGPEDESAPASANASERQQEAAAAAADEGDQLAALVRDAASASESPAVLPLVPPELRCHSVSTI